MTPETMIEEEQTGHTSANAPWQMRLDRLALGKPSRCGGLCLYPLLGEDQGELPYLLLDAALASGALTITEHGTSGAVPELAVTNTSPDRVLILDGEELIGAKQNRIVNTSVLVDAHTTLLLPVSCVEAGRWKEQSAQFSSGAGHYNARGRQKKVAEVSEALLLLGRPSASQSRIWSDIHGKLDRLAVSSPTAALTDLSTAYETDLERYQDALAAPLPHQVGAAFALGGSLVGLDLFDQARTLSALLPKLVASYALDALDERPTDAPPPPAVLADWLQTIARAVPELHPAVGLGQDIRLSAPKLSGAALEYDGAALHLSAFQTTGFSRPMPRMARPSQRRW